MNRTATTVVTTACVGMALGAAYMMNGKTGKKRTRQLKKNTGKALRQVGAIIDNVSYLMK